MLAYACICQGNGFLSGLSDSEQTCLIRDQQDGEYLEETQLFLVKRSIFDKAAIC